MKKRGFTMMEMVLYIAIGLALLSSGFYAYLQARKNAASLGIDASLSIVVTEAKRYVERLNNDLICVYDPDANMVNCNTPAWNVRDYVEGLPAWMDPQMQTLGDLFILNLENVPRQYCHPLSLYDFSKLGMKNWYQEIYDFYGDPETNGQYYDMVYNQCLDAGIFPIFIYNR